MSICGLCRRDSALLHSSGLTEMIKGLVSAQHILRFMNISILIREYRDFGDKIGGFKSWLFQYELCDLGQLLNLF